jgi:hypothetical protein
MTSAALYSFRLDIVSDIAPGAMSASADSRRRSPFWKPKGSCSMWPGVLSS